MTTKTKTEPKKFKKTTSSENIFVSRYGDSRTFPRISFSEKYFMVNMQDLIKGAKYEDLKVTPKFLGESKTIGKYMILDLKDFAKLIDRDLIRKDLVKTAQESLQEDASSDDYFKMMYSNTLRHLDYLLSEKAFASFQFSSFTREFLTKNMSALSTASRKIIVKKEASIG